MIVLDASTAVWLAAGDEPTFVLPRDVVAPPLFWSETTAALHTSAWRGETSPERARGWLRRIRALPVARRSPAALHDRAWAIADEFGWAKTYDAEYLALAEIEDCLLLTVDARLRRGADRTGRVRLPSEL